MSATAMNWPAVTAVPFSFSVPAPGNVVMFTRLNALAGISSGSVNPKSPVANVYAVSSAVVTVVSVPSGGSFTGVTGIVTVPVVLCGGAGVFPWSFTVIVIVASPTKFAVGLKVDSTTAAFNAASVLVNSISASSIPLPVMNVKSPNAAGFSDTVPLTAVMVARMIPLPASTSKNCSAPARSVPMVSSHVSHFDRSG